MWYNIPGKNSADFIEALVSMVALPESLSRQDLYQACMRRESSSPTAMGRGIAFPHPGVPMAKNEGESFIALAYPRFPIDWRAPDGAPVRAAFLILSVSRNAHLTTLSTLAKLCAEEAIYAALRKEASLDEVTALIQASLGL